ncbi:MAG TPA: hypothetical protein VF865_19390, partial [Acidobacteriaceae bacterium]
MVWGTLAVALLLLPLAEDLRCQTQAAGAAAHVDSDADGLDDAVEQQLLEQFAPRFMVGRGDCSGV